PGGEGALAAREEPARDPEALVGLDDADLRAVLVHEDLGKHDARVSPLQRDEVVVAAEAGQAEQLAGAAETAAGAAPRAAGDHDVRATVVDVRAVAELVGEVAVPDVGRRVAGAPLVAEAEHAEGGELRPVGEAAGGVDRPQRPNV